MVRVLRRLKITAMAPDACRGRPDVFVLRCVGVACLARHSQMSAHQRESRLLMFVDHFRHLPRLSCVALEAVHPQLAPMNIGMTGNAIRIHL